MQNDLVADAGGPHLTPHLTPHTSLDTSSWSSAFLCREVKSLNFLWVSCCPEQPEGEGEEEERGDGEHVLQNSEENILCVGIFMCFFFANCGHGEGDFQNSYLWNATFWDICVVCKSWRRKSPWRCLCMQKIEHAADVGGKQAGDQAKAGDVFFRFGW